MGRDRITLGRRFGFARVFLALFLALCLPIGVAAQEARTGLAGLLPDFGLFGDASDAEEAPLRFADNFGRSVGTPGVSGPAHPETPPHLRPSYNLYGMTGLIDMPSAVAAPDGELVTTVSYAGQILRNTLSFQITPRLSGSPKKISTPSPMNLSSVPPCLTASSAIRLR